MERLVRDVHEKHFQPVPYEPWYQPEEALGEVLVLPPLVDVPSCAVVERDRVGKA
jgi:hypothetical protein